MNKTNFFRASAEDFKKIPGSPVAYWCTQKMFRVFSSSKQLIEMFETRNGMSTTNNGLFLRMWHECGLSTCSFGAQTAESAKESGLKWFRYNKGGEFRRWYGNNCYLVNWKNDGADLKKYVADRYGSYSKEIRSEDRYFFEGITWSGVTSSKTGFRFSPSGAVFDSGANGLFAPTRKDLDCVLGLLNSNLTLEFVGAINPTINTGSGTVGYIPVRFCEDAKDQTQSVVRCCIALSNKDWDAYETSWDFAVNPLVALCDSLRPLRSFCQPPQGENPVNPVNPVEKTNSDSSEASLTLRQDQETRNVSGASEKSEFQIEKLYAQLRERWAKDCEEMRRLETENNRIFIEAYGLQDELTPDVPWHEITLTCNPWYRYGVKCEVEKVGGGGGSGALGDRALPIDGELETRLKADTVKELISYAVGCMMGRYSLDKPGLILADQGANETDYYAKIGVDKEYAKFQVDDDGIIPILDNDWFEDDIVTRFKAFIKVAFGEDHFFENMAWIEEALGKDIRSYFTKDFYKDHLQRYQNRPIYWLFQSPKGAFRALVYMHRYKPDMVGGVLGYLRSLQTKVDNQLDVAMRVGADESKSASERVRANKDAVKYAKAKKELDEYEKNVLYPLSTERIEIDLDDGVKVNYRKFGIALKKVAALEG